jgi:hypothetical protein
MTNLVGINVLLHDEGDMVSTSALASCERFIYTELSVPVVNRNILCRRYSHDLSI